MPLSVEVLVKLDLRVEVVVPVQVLVLAVIQDKLQRYCEFFSRPAVHENEMEKEEFPALSTHIGLLFRASLRCALGTDG